MSRIDLTPAQTTATGVRASSSRSAEMSKLSPAPRCTPPMPPVANTRMPASAAMIIVAATVVAPVWPAATASGRSRRLSLGTADPARPRPSISARLSPAFSRPSTTAIVAGTAPWARTSPSTCSAVATFCGYGMPWEMMVDSSATTGRPAASAARTSGATSSGGLPKGLDGCSINPEFIANYVHLAMGSGIKNQEIQRSRVR
jgi:hypothetical protein